MGSEELLEQAQLNFSFRNKFIILHPCGLLVENNTFSKMCVFKILTGYTDYGGYVAKRDSAYTNISVNDHIVTAARQFLSTDNPLPSVFIHDHQQVLYPFWSTDQIL
jgi:hypothetical protein